MWDVILLGTTASSLPSFIWYINEKPESGFLFLGESGVHAYIYIRHIYGGLAKHMLYKSDIVKVQLNMIGLGLQSGVHTVHDIAQYCPRAHHAHTSIQCQAH